MALVTHEFHLVVTVALSDSTLSALALVVVSKSRYQQLTRMHVQRCIADACLYLSDQIWRRLDCLVVKHVYRFTKLQVIAPLVAIWWPNLTCLDLSLVKLGSAAIAHLVQGSWPVLGILDLQGNKLYTAAADLLCTGDWPELHALYLCHNDLGDAAMGFLAKGQWPKLEILLLHSNAIGAYGIGELMQGNWIKLRYFSLDFSRATAATCNMLHLKAVISIWPDSGFVEKLYLSSGAAVLRHAHFGCWPALVKVHFVLSLSTHLCAGFVMILAGLLVLSACAAIYSAKVAFSVCMLWQVVKLPLNLFGMTPLASLSNFNWGRNLLQETCSFGLCLWFTCDTVKCLVDIALAR